MRAFLSHSSTDKNFVGEVAALLGRAKVVYDEFEFSTGDEFFEAITVGLERSGVFVLFASKESLSRYWVGVEIDKARAAVAAKMLARSICYIIDDEVDISAIPSWMRGELATRQTNPRLVALDIRRVLNRELEKRRPHLFLGRNEAMESALDLITSDSRPLITYGLKGIGRRTLLGEVGRNSLSYSKNIKIEIRSGDELPELYLYIQSYMGLISRGAENDFISEARNIDLHELVSQIVIALASICQSGTYPILIDYGALTGDDGRLISGFQLLFSVLSEDVSVDLGIASARRVRSSDGVPLPGLRVTELDVASTQRLIRLLASHERLQLTRDQAESLSRYVAGYPPAANFAIQEAKIYGVAHVVENQRTLVEFNERAFLSSLVNSKKISPTMQSILQTLSAFSPLPREVLVECMRGDLGDSFDESLTALIDLAFVVPKGAHYRITAPIRDAAYRRLNGLRVDASRIVELLEAYLAENDDDDARLELGETLFRAATLSGKASAGAVSLARDLIEITTQSYYDQNYDRVLEIGQRAIDARPNNVDVRRVVAQALVRREHFAQAEEHIAHVTALGALKEAFYIRGFLERTRRDYDAAIAAYKRSIEYGRRGVAVHRELATCYFHLDLLDDAKREIRLAEQADSHNVYVLDLKCTIAMRSGDEEGVRNALELLSRLDAGSFYPHRRSTYELSHGNIEDALKYARIATDTENRPVFETVANLANCQIEAGLIPDAADTLLELDQKFSSIRRDTRLGLHCKLELRRGDARTAEIFWSQITNKDIPVHRALRLNTLKLINAERDLTEVEVAEFESLSEILDESRAKKLLLSAGALSSRD